MAAVPVGTRWELSWPAGGGCGWQGPASPPRTLALVLRPHGDWKGERSLPMRVGRTRRLAKQSEALAVSWGKWWPGLP